MNFVTKYRIQHISFILLLITTLFVFSNKQKSNRDIEQANGQSQSINSANIEPAQHHIDTISISKGDTLYKILSPYNVARKEANEIINLLKHKIDIANLKLGQIIAIKYLKSEDAKIPISLTVNLDDKNKIEVYKDQNAYKLNNISIVFKRDILKIEGSIKNNITSSALKAGVPLKNILEVINTYSHQIDFQREVREGDKFTILLEKFISEDGSSSHFGKTLFSSLNLNGSKYKIYRYKSLDGSEDFFDEAYNSVKRSLLKTPVMAARISSTFGLRTHPISGFTKMHQGVDFAAPAGTPIYAAGNGVISEIGRKGSYGKYIRVSHGNSLHTAYAHASSFAKGLQHGSRVKQGQIIAYVGTSGSATGPHLHYEVIIGNQKINPLKLKLTPTKKLTGKNKEDFDKYKDAIDKTINANQSSAEALGNYIF